MAKKRSVTIVFLVLSLGFFSSYHSRSFAAQKDFPKKEITIIVNMGPGGGRDILARGVGKIMSKHLGVPVVVMNQPGAGGARGMINLYHSAPDGYTIGIGMATEVINQMLEKQEYDCKKFIYLGRVQSSPVLVVVKKDSPFRSIKDFKNFGKPIRQGAFSLTATGPVFGMVIANREGFPLSLIGGYQSAATSVLGVIRGEVEFTCCSPSVAMQYVRGGQIRPITAIYYKHSQDFPDIPTVGEAGYPDLAILSADYWFIAPPEVPRNRIQTLEDALMKTLQDAEFLEWAKVSGVELGPLNGEETRKLVFGLFDLFQQYKGDIEKNLKE